MSVTSDTKVIKNLINGEWVSSNSKVTLDIPNPATNEILAKVPVSTKEDVDQAVAVLKGH